MVTQPDWVQAHDDRALAFERQVEERSAGVLRLALADAARRLAVEYIKVAGDLRTPVPPGVQDTLRAKMRRIVGALLTGFVSELPRIVAALRDAIGRGLQLGTRASSRRPRRLKLQPSPDLNAAVAGVQRTLREDVAAARKAAEGMRLRRYRDATAVLAKANQAVNNVSRAARWAANRAVNEGVRAAADAEGAPALWLAERDACLTCLAYAGEIAEPGEPFPAGLTFGDKSTVPERIYSPPAHPECRCRLQKWYGTEPEFGVQLPNALRREAQRSVLRGDSDYASRPAKMRAADRLLKTQLSGLPETVKLRARKKINDGPAAWRPAVRTAPSSRP